MGGEEGRSVMSVVQQASGCGGEVWRGVVWCVYSWLALQSIEKGGGRGG